MARLRTALAARQDIAEVRRVSKERFGAAAARDYLLGLSKTFDLIGERPRAGTAEPDLGATMRSFRYSAHRIYYLVQGDDILVVRVLHQARDVPAAFGSPN